MNSSKKQRGRPSKTITWPEKQQITVHDLLTVNDVTRVTAQKVLNMAVKEGRYRVVGEVKKWRPTVYEKESIL